MDVRLSQWAVIAVLCGSIAGCKTDPYTRALLENLNAEKRSLEADVYDLEYELQIAQDEADELRAENERLRSSDDSSIDNKSRSSNTKRKPATDRPGSKKESLPPKIDIDVPEIELGEPMPLSKPPMANEKPAANDSGSIPITPPLATSTAVDALEEGELTSKPSKKNASRHELLMPPTQTESEREVVEPSKPPRTPDDQDVTQIYINPFLTGGADFDNKPGDDGLTVVVEPRNAEGRYVPVAGPVSVVLLDPTKRGDDARVARWDFDAVEASRFLKNSAIGVGLHLQMRWPTQPPENSKLRLFVRYESLTGQKLQGQHDVFVTLRDQVSQRWTPKTRRTKKFDSTESPAVEPRMIEPATIEFATPAPVASRTATLPPASSNNEPRRPTWRPDR